MLSSNALSEMMKKKPKIDKTKCYSFLILVWTFQYCQKKVRAGGWGSCFYSSKKGTGAKGQTHMGRVAENVCQESPVP